MVNFIPHLLGPGYIVSIAVWDSDLHCS